MIKMKNEIIIYGQDPRTVFDYCRWNAEEQAMREFIVELKNFAKEFSDNLSKNCGMGVVTEEKVKATMLVSELNKENRNRDVVIVLDTIPERN